VTPETDFKIKTYRAFSLGPNLVFVSPRAANMYVCAECQTFFVRLPIFRTICGTDVSGVIAGILIKDGQFA
jgi:hypothetical protein